MYHELIICSLIGDIISWHQYYRSPVVARNAICKIGNTTKQDPAKTGSCFCIKLYCCLLLVMPLIREWESDPFSLAAIWKIEEPEHFFTDATGIFSDIKNDKRRIERLAGRFLLKHLKADFPLHEIGADEHDKPRIPENVYFFSISHSYPYVAAVISPYAEAGIDIQCFHPRMLQLQNKFLSEEEQSYTAHDPSLITLAWCAKEAAYKWQGKRGVEFIDHLPITEFRRESAKFHIEINLKLNNPNQAIKLNGFVNEHFACCSVYNSVENLNEMII